ARLNKSSLGELTLTDVASDLGRADNTAFAITNGGDGQRNVDPPAVLPNSNRFIVIDALATPQPSKDLGLLVDALGWDEQGNGLADHLLHGVAEDALGPLVPGHHDAVQ